MSKHKIDQECFYCNRTFTTSRSAQGDHFPIPQRHGGTEAVPCCPMCHKLKDTIILDNWPSGLYNELAKDFCKYSPTTRLFLAKVMHVFLDAYYERYPTAESSNV
jgi:hypothetical protein